MQKITVETGGFKLSCLIEGEGLPVICIGSALFYSRVFSDEIKKNLRFIFIDHCGFAPSPERDIKDIEFSMEYLIRHIETIRKKLNLDRFYILGHSGHAFMALEYAKKYSVHILGTILIGVSPDYSENSHHQTDNFFQETASDIRKQFYKNEMSKLPDLIEKEPDKRFVHFCLCSGARNWYQHDFNASHLWKDVETNMQVIDYVWGTVFRDINIAKELYNYKIPTILMLGKYDYVTGPVELWDKIKHNFYDLELKVYEKSGHYPMYEQSRQFDTVLLNWIEINK